MNSESLVSEFLSKYNLSAKRFDKVSMKQGKTPDFKVYSGGELSLYCEVKNAEKDKWLGDKLDKAVPGELVGGARNDPVFNRLSAHIHKATKQFNAVNSNEEFPNVLAFHNQDEMSGFLDLLAVTTGNAYCEDGSVLPIYKSFSEGRVKVDIEKIHLFIWLDDYKPHRLLFNTINNRFLTKLCEVFKVEAESLVLTHS